MTRVLFENWPQKLLAIFIAFILWFFVIRTGARQPRALLANVPYQEVNLPEGLRVTEGQTTVDIEARALIDPSILDEITVEDVKPIVDLSSAKPGVAEYPVQIPKTRFDTMVQFTPLPRRVKLHIERYTQIRLPVDVEQVGDGPLLEGSDWTLSTSAVTVKGVESVLERAQRAVVKVDQGAMRPGQSYELPVLVLDEAGSQLNVSVEPPRVQFSLVPQGILTSAVLPVQVDWRGAVPTGYRLSDYTLSPEVVTISGDPDVLRRIKVVRTEPLRLSNYLRSTTVELRLLPVEGATIEPSAVKVTLRIVPVG